MSKKSIGLIIAAVSALIAAVIICISVFPKGPKAGSSEGPSAEEKTISLPFISEKGGIKIISLFSSDILNPDCNWEQGSDIASIELENISGKYIKQAKVSVSVSGSSYSFKIYDVPAGGKVLAFDTANTPLSGGEPLKIECVSELASGISLMPDVFAISISGISFNITNLAEEDVSGYEARYRLLFDDKYYGGVSFSRAIPALSPQQSFSFTAEECVLGDAVAVAVTEA